MLFHASGFTTAVIGIVGAFYFAYKSGPGANDTHQDLREAQRELCPLTPASKSRCLYPA
jgi:hypothetical protein